jgi:hypothetical protein
MVARGWSAAETLGGICHMDSRPAGMREQRAMRRSLSRIPSGCEDLLVTVPGVCAALQPLATCFCPSGAAEPLIQCHCPPCRYAIAATETKRQKGIKQGKRRKSWHFRLFSLFTLFCLKRGMELSWLPASIRAITYHTNACPISMYAAVDLRRPSGRPI